MVELLEASRSGSVDTYEKLVRYMDEQISKAVLGETMSTTASSAGLGSGQANVHNDVRKELAEDDSDELCETLNATLVAWTVAYNLPGANLPTLSREFEEPEDLAQRATRDKTVKELGYEPTEQYILKTYGDGWVRSQAKASGGGMFTGLLPGAEQTANGWNCRCSVIQLSQAQAESMGYDSGAAAPKTEFQHYTNPRTGEAMLIPKGVDPGFGYNPGSDQAQQLRDALAAKVKGFRDGD